MFHSGTKSCAIEKDTHRNHHRNTKDDLVGGGGLEVFTGYSELRDSLEDHHRYTMDDLGCGEGRGSVRSLYWILRIERFTQRPPP